MTEPAERPTTTVASGGLTNLTELVRQHAASRPHVEALVTPASVEGDAGQPSGVRRSLTWIELDSAIDALAAGLVAQGLVAGHRVGILGENTHEFVLAYFAALRAGLVAVPINPQLSPIELDQLIADCGPRLIFAPTDPGRAGIAYVALTVEGLAGVSVVGAGPVSSPKDKESLAVLLYTAGTSGAPKAAMLSHRALLAHVDQSARYEVITTETVMAAVLPLFHVYGLNAVLGSWIRAGARLVMMTSLTGLFDVVATEQVTNLPLAPSALAAIIDDERSTRLADSVTTVLSGAVPLSAELRDDFAARTGLRIEQGYGMTEAAPGISVTFDNPVARPQTEDADRDRDYGRSDDPEEPLDDGELGNLGTQRPPSEHGHVGHPLPGVEVRIGDGSDDGGEPDEISLRGDNLFSGYWPDGLGGPDADGWFRTGDIGYLREGELYLVDRSRELIIVNGFNVYPAEVEEALAELPGVAAVAVVGQPDPHTGEQVVAFVTGSVTEAAVNDFCSDRLAKFKRPVSVRVVDDLPRGATGKVRKGALRALLGSTDG